MMRQASESTQSKVLALLGFLFAVPAIYFVLGSLLKYQLGLLQNTDIVVIPPAVILGGVLLALLANLPPCLKQLTTQSKSAFFRIAFSINGIVVLLCTGCLAVLLVYIVSENLLESIGP